MILLSKRKRNLRNRKKAEEIEELYNVIVKSGKTVDEVKAIIEA